MSFYYFTSGLGQKYTKSLWSVRNKTRIGMRYQEWKYQFRTYCRTQGGFKMAYAFNAFIGCLQKQSVES